jgi:hypothetical protein
LLAVSHLFPEAGDMNVQEKFLAFCEQISGIRFPADHAIYK